MIRVDLGPCADEKEEQVINSEWPRKPRLTSKVLRGLRVAISMADQASIKQDKKSKNDIKAASEWIEDMILYREKKKRMDAALDKQVKRHRNKP